MSTNLQELLSQASAIRAEIEVVTNRQRVSALDDVRNDVNLYSLTKAEVFGSRIGKEPGTKPKKSSANAKYGDGNGQTWVGRGKRPAWLNEALSAGKPLTSFLLA